MFRLIDLELRDPNIPGKKGYEYGYAIFEQLPNIHVVSSKHYLALYVNVSDIDATTMKQENSEDKEVQLSLSTKELIDEENSDTFCPTILKAINN